MSSHRARILGVFAAPNLATDEASRLGRIVHQIWIALLLSSAIIGSLDFYRGTYSTPLALAAASPLLLLAWWLNRAGRCRLAGFLMLLGLLGVLTFLMLSANGIHDLGLAGLPVLLIMAALFLERRGLIFATTLVIGALAVVAYADIYTLGPFDPQPVKGASWLDFFIVAAILLIAALASHSAIDSLRVSLEKLSRSEARLEAQNAELERMTYALSHEMKSPLVTVKGFLGRLQAELERGDFERAQDDLQRIDHATTRLHQQIVELLDLSRVGYAKREPEVVSLREVIDDSLEGLQSQLSGSNAVFSVSGQLDIASSDRARLVEVFQNLIGNAIKYSADAAPPVIDVQLSCADRPGHGLIRIEDQGVGIEPKYHDRVFRLFERLDANGDGTGIGLALVKRIVETHGGSIWIESEGKGEGAAFCFTLPLAESD